MLVFSSVEERKRKIILFYKRCPIVRWFWNKDCFNSLSWKAFTIFKSVLHGGMGLLHGCWDYSRNPSSLGSACKNQSWFNTPPMPGRLARRVSLQINMRFGSLSSLSFIICVKIISYVGVCSKTDIFDKVSGLFEALKVFTKYHVLTKAFSAKDCIRS